MSPPSVVMRFSRIQGSPSPARITWPDIKRSGSIVEFSTNTLLKYTPPSNSKEDHIHTKYKCLYHHKKLPTHIHTNKQTNGFSIRRTRRLASVFRSMDGNVLPFCKQSRACTSYTCNPTWCTKFHLTLPAWPCASWLGNCSVTVEILKISMFDSLLELPAKVSEAHQTCFWLGRGDSAGNREEHKCRPDWCKAPQFNAARGHGNLNGVQ